MRILLTNDDSIHSVALQRLARALVDKGFELFVVAPATEQSGVGRACCLRGKLEVEAFEGLGCPAWTTTGTPSDCVNLAISHLLEGKRPDLVISGINWGLNVTIPVIFTSGTVGGALEGVAFGIPALSVSQCLPEPIQFIQQKIDYLAHEGLMKCIDVAVQRTVQYAEMLAQTSDPVVHNVNYPYPVTLETPEESTRLCNIMHGKGEEFPAYGGFYQEVDGVYRFKMPPTLQQEPVPGTDIDALTRGKISHSIIDLRRLCS